jgi:O-antigen/teichoic acid export membrane protein
MPPRPVSLAPSMTHTLTRAGTLARGAAWNQLGQALPVLAALFLVPRLIQTLGVDRFGILSLAWMLIGYFTLFDLGVSGALTRLVAERLASRREDEVPALVWTALGLTTVMGLVGAGLLAGSARWLVGHALRIPAALQPEALRLTWVLAAALPVVTGTAALAGVLSAQQRFGALNAIRIPMGILTYLAPLLALRVAPGLVSVALALAFVRVLGGIAHLAACLASTPGLGARIVTRRSLLGPILSFGGWMTVTAVVGPMMVYFDRFLIGGRLSMAQVAYYTTPYDLLARLGILTVPILSVMFPALAASFDTDRPRAGRLFDWSVRAVASLLFPAALIMAVFAREVLTLWLGPGLAEHSHAVMRLLAFGVYANCIAQVALTLLQSSGRPDLGARVHLIEFPFYLLALWLLLGGHGILGVAVAWLIRVSADAVVLFVLARGRLGEDASGVRTALFAGGGGALVMVAGCLLPGSAARLVFVAAALAGYAVLAWRQVAVPGLRALRETAPAGPRS